MSFQGRRIFLRSTILHGISVFPNCLSVRCCSSKTKQEFGRHFEQVVVQSLRKYAFDVSVCGGPKDRGIDFRGAWLLKRSPVRMIGQCRRYKRRLGPKHVRELEGTLTHEAKGTLGIIVTECGYSKDAYGVFMGSLYPIVLSTLKGYSDELLQWYFDQANYEKCGSKVEEPAGTDFTHSVHYKMVGLHSSSVHQNVNCYVSSNVEMNESEIIDIKEGSYLQQRSAMVQENATSTFSPKHVRDNNETPELNNSLGSDQSNRFKTKVTDDESLSNDLTDIDGSLEQLTYSNISDMGLGVFTMFELNPAARKLLPHLVVGIKYKRRNSKAPELFINEDDSFVSLPE